MYVIERWTGKSWYASLCSPYKSMSEVNKHLKEYWWHYTSTNPYRINDYNPKKQSRYSAPKFNPYRDWNSDNGMVVKI
jgi:hypothetical protein